MTLSSKKTQLLVISHVCTWAFLIVLTFLYSNHSDIHTADLITAKRIDIVNDDGTTVMAIANKQRIAAPRMNGKEYPVEMIERQHFAGFIFFNEEGDEIGGLLFNGTKLSDGRKFGAGHLSFDRYQDNQVINLEHKENIHGLVKSGLTIYDRTGNGAFGKNLDLMHEYHYQSITKERKQEIINEIRQMKANGDLGYERLFIGSENNTPQLSMKDAMGNQRVKLFIDSSNVAQLQFYDTKGHLIDYFPK